MFMMCSFMYMRFNNNNNNNKPAQPNLEAFKRFELGYMGRH